MFFIFPVLVPPSIQMLFSLFVILSEKKQEEKSIAFSSCFNLIYFTLLKFSFQVNLAYL